ncbi:uncharacterized protein LOC144477887, partial [Augochlora pura]
MEETPQNSAVGVHSAKYWPEKPALWFAQLDAQFSLRGITSEETKYCHVVSQLDAKTAQEIEDILLAPPAERKYSHVKEELIRRLSTSKQSKIKQLLEHEEIGDRTPSQFLRHIRALAGTDVPEDFMRTLWMSRLPASMQSVLATQDGVALEKMAVLADRIAEVTPTQMYPAAPSSSVAAFGDINALVEKVAAMVVDKMGARGRSRRRSVGNLGFYLQFPRRLRNNQL